MRKLNMEAKGTESKLQGSKTNSVRSDVCSTSSPSAKCYVWLEGLVIEHRSKPLSVHISTAPICLSFGQFTRGRLLKEISETFERLLLRGDNYSSLSEDDSLTV